MLHFVKSCWSHTPLIDDNVSLLNELWGVDE